MFIGYFLLVLFDLHDERHLHFGSLFCNHIFAVIYVFHGIIGNL